MTYFFWQNTNFTLNWRKFELIPHFWNNVQRFAVFPKKVKSVFIIITREGEALESIRIDNIHSEGFIEGQSQSIKVYFV